MKKIVSIALSSVFFLALTGGPVWAAGQQQSNQKGNQQQQQSQSSQQQQKVPGTLASHYPAVEAARWQGATLLSDQGKKLGTINDIGYAYGSVNYLMVEGTDSQIHPVPADKVRVHNGEFRATFDQQTFKQSPTFQPSRAMTQSGWESQVRGYYSQQGKSGQQNQQQQNQQNQQQQKKQQQMNQQKNQQQNQQQQNQPNQQGQQNQQNK